MDKAHERRFEFLAAALLLTVWGGAGLLTDRAGYTDALYEPDYTILHAPPDGVLAEAGFLAGDTVVAVEGTPVEELGMYSRWPRSLSRRPGESLQMTVRRDGALVDGVVVYRERPPAVRAGQLAQVLLYQAFLWLGIWVLFTTPGLHAGRLAALGVIAGLAVPGPSLGSFNGLRDHLQVAAEILMLTVLLHFLLLFPRAKAPARSRWIGLLYLPWVGLLGTQAVELATHPRMYHAFGGYIGSLFMGLFLAQAAAVVHTGVTLGGGERRRSGIGLLLAGWAVAVLPFLAALAVRASAPGARIPGQVLLPFLLSAIPLGLALAVRAQGRGAATSAD